MSSSEFLKVKSLTLLARNTEDGEEDSFLQFSHG